MLFTLLITCLYCSLHAQGFDKFDELAALQSLTAKDTAATNVHLGRFGVKAVFPNVEVWMSWEDHLVGLTTFDSVGTAFLEIKEAEITQPGRLRFRAEVDSGIWIELDARLGKLFIHQQCHTLAFENRWP